MIVKRIVFVVAASISLAALAFYGTGPLLRWLRAATPNEQAVALLIGVVLLGMACAFGYSVVLNEREIRRRTGRIYIDPSRAKSKDRW